MSELNDGIVSGNFLLASWKSRHSLIDQLAAMQSPRYRLRGQGQFGSILHLAVQYERVEILRVLLHIPAAAENLMLPDTYSKAPIHLAIEQANPRLLRCLLCYTPSSYRQAQWALTRHGQSQADLFGEALRLFRWRHLIVLLEVGIEQGLPIQAMLENHDFWQALCQQFRRRYKKKVVRDIFTAMLKDTKNVIDWLNQNYAELQGYETLMTNLKIASTIGELRYWINLGLRGETTPVAPLLAPEYIADWYDLKKPLSALLVECARLHDNFSAEKTMTIFFSYFQSHYQGMASTAVFTELMTFYLEHLAWGFLNSHRHDQDLGRVFFLNDMHCQASTQHYARLAESLRNNPSTAISIAQTVAQCFNNQLRAMGDDLVQINRFAQCLYACVTAAWFTEQLEPQESPERMISWLFESLKSHAIFSPRMNWIAALANTRFSFGYPLVEVKLSLAELVAGNGFICDESATSSLYFNHKSPPSYYPELGLRFSFFQVSRSVLQGLDIRLDAMTPQELEKHRILSLAVRPLLERPLVFDMDQREIPKQPILQSVTYQPIVKGKKELLPTNFQDENKLNFIRKLIIDSDEEYELRKEALKLWLKPTANDNERIVDELIVREADVFSLFQARRALMLVHEQLIFYRELRINHRLVNPKSRAVTLYLTKLRLADQLNHFQSRELSPSQDQEQAYWRLRDDIFKAVSDDEIRLALNGWRHNALPELQASLVPVIDSLLGYVDGFFVKTDDSTWSALLWEKLIDTLHITSVIDQNIPVLQEIQKAWQDKLSQLQRPEAYVSWSKSAENFLKTLKSTLLNDFIDRRHQIENRFVEYQHLYQTYSSCEDLLPVALLDDNPLFKHSWLQYGRINLRPYSDREAVFECMRIAVARRQPEFCQLLEAAGLDPFILPPQHQWRFAHANEKAPLVMILSYKEQDNTPEGKIRLRLKKELEKKQKMLQWICDCVAARLQPEYIWQRYGTEGPFASAYYKAVYHSFTQLNWILVNYIRINYGINLSKSAELSPGDLAWQYFSTTFDSIRSAFVTVDESRMIDLANYFHFSQEQFMRAIPEPEEFSIRITNFLDSQEIKLLPGKLHAYIKEVVTGLDKYLRTHSDNLTNEQRYRQLIGGLENNRTLVTSYEEFLEKRNKESEILKQPRVSEERRLREQAERRTEEERRAREEADRRTEEERRAREEADRRAEEERRAREEAERRAEEDRRAKDNEIKMLHEQLRLFQSQQRFSSPSAGAVSDGASSSRPGV
jgi:hypothetical protein